MKLGSLASLLIALFPSMVRESETWKTPDGFLSVERPDPARFKELPDPPPPVLVLWVSDDDSVKVGVVKVELPAGVVKLIQSSAEEGLAKETGGKVTRLPTKRVSGYEVWNMSATSPSADFTQAIVLHDGVAYKLMAGASPGNIQDAAIGRFMDSLSIVPPTPTQPRRSPIQALADRIATYKISNAIPGAAFWLLVALMLYIRKKKTRGNP